MHKTIQMRGARCASLSFIAHPERRAQQRMTREAMHALRAAGHDVDISDLYAMGFNPVSDRRNFVTGTTGVLPAAERRGLRCRAWRFAPDIQAEMDKLFRCDCTDSAVAYCGGSDVAGRSSSCMDRYASLVVCWLSFYSFTVVAIWFDRFFWGVFLGKRCCICLSPSALRFAVPILYFPKSAWGGSLWNKSKKTGFPPSSLPLLFFPISITGLCFLRHASP